VKLRIFQIDAFTNRLFGGNPAAVVLLERELTDGMMQRVAAENNLSETAFLLPGDGSWDLRWFTPTTEVDLCGHATLASAHVLFNEGLAGGELVRFNSASGALAVRRAGSLLTLDFPARPPEPVQVSLAEYGRALGIEPLAVFAARDHLALYGSEEDVAELEPDMELLAGLETFAVMATAPGTDVDFVSRFFAPKAGIPEDPVTGSAHCTLTPFWAERLGRTDLKARQISTRGGELRCTMQGDRVLIAGRAVEYLRGEITING
jgi:PhzF family phenazine biosynthesis protein